MQKYALVCCNNSLANFTSGYHAVVNTPLNNVGVDNELNSLPFFELLTLSDKVLSARPSINVTSPCFNGITDGPNSTTTTIDAIFTSQANNGVVGMGTQYISVSADSSTLTPLQQSSWIIFIAHFFELESRGKEIYDIIAQMYTCHQSNLAKSGSKNIAWTTYDVVNNAWTLRADNYLTTLVKDAGMKLVTSNTSQSTTYKNVKDFQQALSTVDFVIDDTPAANFKTDFVYADWLNKAGLKPNNSASFIALKQVYRTDNLINKNGYSDFPVRGTARADLMISDIIHMVYSTYEPLYNMTWIRTFAQLNKPAFISNTSYPSCTDPVARISKTDVCSIGAFNPNSNSTNTPNQSTGYGVHKSLSAGAKAGIAVGVIAVVAGLAMFGIFKYRRRSSVPKEGTFVKMDDM
ncbi:hypothetical protein INT47_011553 [Mucor saturninus]|uniref:Periplasmic binding protein n=1 Tax=Mucor saturninus TaxID=64648 RepID=A0A8H7QXL9_9FUNG|nr:hypothetical protein INT47_011553 [Mucor saturninus]